MKLWLQHHRLPQRSLVIYNSESEPTPPDALAAELAAMRAGLNDELSGLNTEIAQAGLARGVTGIDYDPHQKALVLANPNTGRSDQGTLSLAGFVVADEADATKLVQTLKALVDDELVLGLDGDEYFDVTSGDTLSSEQAAEIVFRQADVRIVRTNANSIPEGSAARLSGADDLLPPRAEEPSPRQAATGLTYDPTTQPSGVDLTGSGRPAEIFSNEGAQSAERTNSTELLAEELSQIEAILGEDSQAFLDNRPEGESAIKTMATLRVLSILGYHSRIAREKLSEINERIAHVGDLELTPDQLARRISHVEILHDLEAQMINQQAEAGDYEAAYRSVLNRTAAIDSRSIISLIDKVGAVNSGLEITADAADNEIENVTLAELSPEVVAQLNNARAFVNAFAKSFPKKNGLYTEAIQAINDGNLEAIKPLIESMLNYSLRHWWRGMYAKDYITVPNPNQTATRNNPRPQQRILFNAENILDDPEIVASALRELDAYQAATTKMMELAQAEMETQAQRERATQLMSVIGAVDGGLSDTAQTALTALENGNLTEAAALIDQMLLANDKVTDKSITAMALLADPVALEALLVELGGDAAINAVNKSPERALMDEMATKIEAASQPGSAEYLAAQDRLAHWADVDPIGFQNLVDQHGGEEAVITGLISVVVFNSGMQMHLEEHDISQTDMPLMMKTYQDMMGLGPHWNWADESWDSLYNNIALTIATAPFAWAAVARFMRPVTSALGVTSKPGTALVVTGQGTSVIGRTTAVPAAGVRLGSRSLNQLNAKQMALLKSIRSMQGSTVPREIERMATRRVQLANQLGVKPSAVDDLLRQLDDGVRGVGAGRPSPVIGAIDDVANPTRPQSLSFKVGDRTFSRGMKVRYEKAGGGQVDMYVVGRSADGGVMLRPTPLDDVLMRANTTTDELYRASTMSVVKPGSVGRITPYLDDLAAPRAVSTAPRRASFAQGFDDAALNLDDLARVAARETADNDALRSRLAHMATAARDGMDDVVARALIDKLDDTALASVRTAAREGVDSLRTVMVQKIAPLIDDMAHASDDVAMRLADTGTDGATWARPNLPRQGGGLGPRNGPGRLPVVRPQPPAIRPGTNVAPLRNTAVVPRNPRLDLPVVANGPRLGLTPKMLTAELANSNIPQTIVTRLTSMVSKGVRLARAELDDFVATVRALPRHEQAFIAGALATPVLLQNPVIEATVKELNTAGAVPMIEPAPLALENVDPLMADQVEDLVSAGLPPEKAIEAAEIMQPVKEISVTATNLNFRSEPNLKASKLGKLQPNSRITLVDEPTIQADGYVWQKIRDGSGTEGYIAVESLDGTKQYAIFGERQPDAPDWAFVKPVTISANNLTLRTGPATGNDPVASLNRQMTDVTSTGRTHIEGNHVWAEVKTGAGQIGWVALGTEDGQTTFAQFDDPRQTTI